MTEQFFGKSYSLTEKVQTLLNARTQLIHEFRKWDELITEIIFQLNLWYLEPEKRREPLIIATQSPSLKNFQGLIKRLSELMLYENSYFHLDFKAIIQTSRQGLDDLEAAAQTYNGKVLFVSICDNEYHFNIQEWLIRFNL